MAKGRRIFSREVVTPITAISFIVVALTGILLLLEVRSGMVKGLHEVMSVVFVVFAAIHLASNWTSMRSYMKRPVAAALAVAVGLVVVSLVGGGGPQGGGRPRGADVMRLVETASLAQIAPLYGMAEEDAAGLLRRHGLTVSSEGQTIDEIAESSGRRPQEILNCLSPGGRSSDPR